MTQTSEEYIQLQELNTDLENKIRERTRELELVNEQKTNTFINLAHETKTPLTLIRNYLHDYINRHGETKELKVIQANINKLCKDVCNFFDLEKIHKGQHLYDHDQVVNFSKILLAGIILFEKYAANKRIVLKKNITADLCVKADPEAIYRIINNLIENAVKYSPDEGEIEIQLYRTEEEIFFSVKDNGPGISKKLQEKIFEPYYQVNSAQQNRQGMGLGLAIISRIVESLNGTLVLESDPDQHPGTLIGVRLLHHPFPMYNIVNEVNTKDFYLDIENLEAEDRIVNDEWSTILIVEDNISFLNYLSEKLNTRYNIYIATSGKQAIEKLKNFNHIDLIVSDVMMDHGNGFDLYRYVASQKRLIHLPVIFITAKTTYTDKMEGLALGAIDYIYKPFLIEELVAKIESILSTLHYQRIALIDSAHRQHMANRVMLADKNVQVHSRFEQNCSEYMLTNREIDVVKLLVKGKTYKAIAETLHISDKTVGKHISNIFEKTKVRNKLELLNTLYNC